MKPPFFPILAFVLSLATVFSGCSAPSKTDVTAADRLMTGNLVAFIQGQVATNGGLLGPASSTNMSINCSWRFRSDTNGAQIFTDAKLFPEIDQFFRSSLGTPDIDTEHLPGQYFVGYSVRKAGAAIQYAIAPSPFADVPNPLLHLIILKQRKIF